MIPKTIHYCWFGKSPLPESAKKCIESWKKFFPDYEIKEWNEDNYSVYKIPYTQQAYDAKKYAFVSDYARFDILYQYGGIYFDTDVEVIKPFDDIISKGAFMGCETDAECGLTVAPGLGIACAPGLEIYKEILDFYDNEQFINHDGSENTETVVIKTTNILKKHGLKNEVGIQQIAGINIYPKEYFNPLNNNTGKLEITENTHSIHLYAMTWLSERDRIISRLSRPFHRIFGDTCFQWVKKLLRRK